MKKTHSPTIVLAVTAALLSGALLVSAASESRNRPRENPSPEPRDEVRRDAPPGGSPMEAGRWAELLPPDQRERLRGLFEAQRERTRDLEARLRELHQQVSRLSLSGEPNEDQLHRLAEEIGALESKKILLRAQALSKIGARLTPEQRERMRDRIAGFIERGGVSGPLLERNQLRRLGPAAGLRPREGRPEGRLDPLPPERRERGEPERSLREWRQPEGREADAAPPLRDLPRRELRRPEGGPPDEIRRPDARRDEPQSEVRRPDARRDEPRREPRMEEGKSDRPEAREGRKEEARETRKDEARAEKKKPRDEGEAREGEKKRSEEKDR